MITQQPLICLSLTSQSPGYWPCCAPMWSGSVTSQFGWHGSTSLCCESKFRYAVVLHSALLLRNGKPSRPVLQLWFQHFWYHCHSLLYFCSWCRFPAVPVHLTHRACFKCFYQPSLVHPTTSGVDSGPSWFLAELHVGGSLNMLTFTAMSVFVLWWRGQLRWQKIT